MRIGVNLLFLIPGEVGGTETYARQLLGALVNQSPGDEVQLFCNRENAGSFGDLPAATVVPCAVNASFRPGRILYEQVMLPPVVAKHALDVLWSPGYTSPFRSPCPSVVTIHDLQFKHHPEDFSLSELLATRLLVKLSCARANHILTDSQASADDIVRLGGVPAERVTAAHLGVAGEFFDRFAQPRADALLREAGVAPFILTVANSYPHKNLAALVRAFGRIEREIPHALVIVGHPRRGEAALAAACGGLHAPERVLRPRNLSREALRALYQAASLFVFSTQFEGFGLPVIEAMASGTPVACSSIPCLREIAGDAAEFFDPEKEPEITEAIRRLLNAEDRRAELRARGLRWAREFTWQRTAARTREVFARAAARETNA